VGRFDFVQSLRANHSKVLSGFFEWQRIAGRAPHKDCQVTH
jgi:hypothetical protein